MKSEILSLLREKAADAPAGENQPSGMPAGKEQPSGREYISGQELCSRFGVSRTAVWKVINQLKEEGYEIEAVQNKGYRLKASPDVIGEIELGSRLQTRGEGHWAGNSLIYYCLLYTSRQNTAWIMYSTTLRYHPITGYMRSAP